MWALVAVVSDHGWRPLSDPQPPPPVQKFLFYISSVFPYLFLCSCVSFSGRHYTAGCCAHVLQKPVLSSSDMPNTYADDGGSRRVQWQDKRDGIDYSGVADKIHIVYIHFFFMLVSICKGKLKIALDNSFAKFTAAFSLLIKPKTVEKVQLMISNIGPHCQHFVNCVSQVPSDRMWLITWNDPVKFSNRLLYSLDWTLPIMWWTDVFLGEV